MTHLLVHTLHCFNYNSPLVSFPGLGVCYHSFTVCGKGCLQMQLAGQAVCACTVGILLLAAQKNLIRHACAQYRDIVKSPAMHTLHARELLTCILLPFCILQSTGGAAHAFPGEYAYAQMGRSLCISSFCVIGSSQPHQQLNARGRDTDEQSKCQQTYKA